MDPNAALAIVRDENADLLDRASAALELDRWLWHGGFAPDDFTAQDREKLNDWRVATVRLLDSLAHAS